MRQCCSPKIQVHVHGKGWWISQQDIPLPTDKGSEGVEFLCFPTLEVQICIIWWIHILRITSGGSLHDSDLAHLLLGICMCSLVLEIHVCDLVLGIYVCNLCLGLCRHLPEQLGSGHLPVQPGSGRLIVRPGSEHLRV